MHQVMNTHVCAEELVVRGLRHIVGVELAALVGLFAVVRVGLLALVCRRLTSCCCVYVLVTALYCGV
jgi:uncharacterized membrane-anchored protein